MVVLIIYKNEEDPIKNEGARVLTTLNIVFSDAQGQLTLQSVVGFGRMQTHLHSYGCPNYLHPIKTEGARVLTTFSPI